MAQTLYIRFSSESLAFGRYEAAGGGRFTYKPWPIRRRASLAANLHEALQALPMAQQVSRTEVVLPTRTALVPLADFDEADCARIYDFCVRDDQPHRVFYDTLPAANAVLLYALAEDACRAFEEALPTVHYTSSQMHTLRRLTAYAHRPGGQRRLFAYLHEHNADVAAFDGTRLLLVNTYEVTAAEDVVYYAFNVADKLQLKPESDLFFVIGPAFQREPAAQAFRHYAQHVSALKPAELVDVPQAEAETEVPFDLLAAAAR